MWKHTGKLCLSGFVGVTLLLGALQASAADHSRPRGPGRPGTGPGGPGRPGTGPGGPGRPNAGPRAPVTREGTPNQHVSLVSLDWEVEPTTGQLRIQLPAGDYYAVADRDKCGLVVNADTVKAWHSIAQ